MPSVCSAHRWCCLHTLTSQENSQMLCWVRPLPTQQPCSQQCSLCCSACHRQPIISVDYNLQPTRFLPLIDYHRILISLRFHLRSGKLSRPQMKAFTTSRENKVDGSWGMTHAFKYFCVFSYTLYTLRGYFTSKYIDY